MACGGAGRDALPRRADRLRRPRPRPLPRPRPQGRARRRPGAARGARRAACCGSTSPPGSRASTSAPDPADTPFQLAQRLAAEAWGARRSWFLVNGGSGGNHAICLALAHARRAGRRPAQRPLLDHRRPRPLRPAAALRRARARPRARHRPLPDPGVARRGARRRARRGRGDDRLADLLRRRRRRRRAGRGRPRARRRRWSSTRPGARTCTSPRRCRRRRSSAAPTSCSPRPTRSSARSPSRRSSTSATAAIGSTSGSSTAP